MIKVNKLALLIRRGIIKTKAERLREKNEDEKTKFFDIWEHKEKNKTKSQMSREKMAYPAPKLPLPGHAERFVHHYLTVRSLSKMTCSILRLYLCS